MEIDYTGKTLEEFEKEFDNRYRIKKIDDYEFWLCADFRPNRKNLVLTSPKNIGKEKTNNDTIYYYKYVKDYIASNKDKLIIKTIEFF
jgi:hypothetical protein